MSENPTLAKQTIAEALDYALQEHGLDDMGFSTSYAADIVIEALKEAGYTPVKTETLPVCTCPASSLFSGSVGRDCPTHT